MFTITWDPIWPAPPGMQFFWTLAAIVWLAALSLWAYFGVWHGSDRRRKMVLVLRLLAIAMVGLAMLRPTIVYAERSEQPSTLILLGDVSRSMLIEDAVGDRSRWDLLVQTLRRSEEQLATLSHDYQIARYGFAEQLQDVLDLDAKPQGQQTAIGAALQDAYQRHSHQRIAGIVLLGDGAERAVGPRDLPAQAAARILADLRVPVFSVGFGEVSLTGQTADVAVRDVQAPRSIFVKNNLDVGADILQRGFEGKPIKVMLKVEDSAGNTTVAETAPLWRSDQAEQLRQMRLRWRPTLPGDYKLTVEAEQLDGEAITANNSFSTFVTVQKGGLSVLYLEGSIRAPEPKFIGRALDESADIRVDRKVLFQPWLAGSRVVGNDWFEPGQYDVYILGNLDADRLGDHHWEGLRDAVGRGAGLIMIGGDHSFGPGGHAGTAIAEVLPLRMGRFERQTGDERRNDMHFNEPLQMLPTAVGLRYVMRLSAMGNDAATWRALRPLDGANRFSESNVKQGAQVLARSANDDPLLIAWELAPGRVMAFAGDTTWHWVLEGHAGEHIRFWRQTILWLAHKDEENQGNVTLELDGRRYRTGQKVKMTATATDADGNPVADARFEVTVEPSGPREDGKDRVAMRTAAGSAAGEYSETGQPGEYRVRLIARREDQIIGTAQVRFLVYEEDLEWDNPANLPLLQSIAQQTDGQYIPPEEFSSFLSQFRDRPLSSYLRPRELTVWDKWPFLLLFVALLSTEWFLRKRSGLA